MIASCNMVADSDADLCLNPGLFAKIEFILYTG